MKNVLFVLFFVSALCTKTANATTQHCQTSSFGKNFVFGVLGSYSTFSSLNVRLRITTAMQKHASVRVTAPSTNQDRTYVISNYTTVGLNGSFIQFENGTQFKGIEVSSDVDISVTVFTSAGSYTEGFLVLPVNALGTRYVTASYTVYSKYSSEILIAGVESDTDVTLNTITKDRLRSVRRMFNLQKFETYQFKSTYDISGSIVTSNKPVAVLSGSAYAQVPAGSRGAQYLVEQMIPTKYWARKFIIPSIYPRKHFVLRLFADQDNTEVHYYNSTKHFAVYMNKGSMEELLFGTDTVVVLANKAISVIQYGHDGDNMVGNPFMANTQGISQYLESYKFVTNDFYHTGDTVAITILKNSTSGLLLNEHPMSYWNAKNTTVSPPMDEYITLFVNVSYNSFYHLHHSGGIKFGAVIYGLLTLGVAYGCPLQLTLTDNDCKIISSSTTLLVSPVTSASTDFSTQKVKTGKGTWCFHCEGMTHLKYCDKVSKCQNEGEVCYVQRYTRSLDVGLFRSGCAHPQQCSNSDSNGGCFKCCDGNFCNSAGCGDDGFPAPGQRGPICFDCTHEGKDEECNIVQLCHSNQVCMIEKYEWGDNDFHYIRGCSESQAIQRKRKGMIPYVLSVVKILLNVVQVCTRKRSESELSTRSAPVCSHCCHSDFCNMNCTSVHTAPAIVG